MYSEMSPLLTICRLYMLFTKIDWKPRQRNRGTKQSILGVNSSFITLVRSCKIVFPVARAMGSSAGFKRNRIHGPQILTVPRKIKRMEVEPFQPGPPPAWMSINLVMMYTQRLPNTWELGCVSRVVQRPSCRYSRKYPHDDLGFHRWNS